MAKPLTKKESDLLKKEFLETYKATKGGLINACNLIGVPKQTVTYWKQNDPQFAEQLEDVKETIYDELEASMFERAIKGSDTLAIWISKTKMANRGYVERKEVTGKDGAPLNEIKINRDQYEAILKLNEEKY